MPATTRTQAVSPGYIYTVTASLEAIVRDVETDKLLCKANNGSQGMFVAIGGTVSITTSDPTATITQSSTNSGGARFEVHQTRPDTGEEGVIYLIPITSSTDEENEYEEWIWVKGEWERLGTTGVNLSNYATLTDANTYSGDNTFNGLLSKKNSGSLGDTSVLNRYEADARYGRLAGGNIWDGNQYINTGGTLTIHPNAVIVANSIRGNGDAGLDLTNVSDITAYNAHVDTLHVVDIAANEGSTIHILSTVNVDDSMYIHKTLFVDNIHANTHEAVSIASNASVVGDLFVNKDVQIWGNLGVHLNSGLYVATIGGNGVSLINVNNSLNIKNNYGLHASTIVANTADKKLTIKAETIKVGVANSSNAILSGVSSLNSGNTKLILNDASKHGHTTLSNDLEIVSAESRLFVGHISGVRSLCSDDIVVTFDSDSYPARIHINPATSLEVAQLSGVQSLQNANVQVIYDDTSVSHSSEAMLVRALEGIKVTSNIFNTPEVTISPSKIEAFQLNADSFGSGKYGLRLTPDSCQLYGIDFAYGDVWSSYPMDGGALSAFLSSDTVKIMKPALTLYTTGVASLAFGEAPKVLFRTFLNDGETAAIFEFQSGYWSNDSHSAIATGMVDLRKPSLSTAALHKYSLINKNELERLILVKTDSSDGTIAIGESAQVGIDNGIAIGTQAVVGEDAEGSAIAIGAESNSNGPVSVAIGVAAQSTEVGTIAIGAAAQSDSYGAVSIGASTAAYMEGAIAIGVNANSENIAIGYNTSASVAGLAIGDSASAAIGELNITVGGGYDSHHAGARCSMLLYGGTSYAERDTTGYLKFEVGNTAYADRENSDAQNDTITISKPNLWSALDRAKYRGAQPYASYAVSAVNDIPALEPNSITHIYTATDAVDIDLSNITLAQHDTAVTTAELWIEVTTAGATITWPDDMLWPDEADPTTAPSFSGPEESTEVGYTTQRLYCITLRTQPVVNIATGNADIPLLIATIAYTLDHKVASASS